MANKIFPCLWFDGKAKEAAEFYCKVFPNSKITFSSQLVTLWEANGQKYMGLNGGPMYTFSPATSFVVECEDQKEIDYYWEALGKEGKYNRCGWLDDKFGVSWQIVPVILGELMGDPAKAQRVAAAYMQMTKFDIEKLKNA